MLTEMIVNGIHLKDDNKINAKILQVSLSIYSLCNTTYYLDFNVYYIIIVTNTNITCIYIIRMK
jgi:hypothetical protein